MVGDQTEALDTFARHSHQMEYRKAVRLAAHHPVEGGQLTDTVGSGEHGRAADAGVSVGGVGGIEFVGATDPFQSRYVFDGVINGEGVVARYPEDLVDSQLGDSVEDVFGNRGLVHRDSCSVWGLTV